MRHKYFTFFIIILHVSFLAKAQNTPPEMEWQKNYGDAYDQQGYAIAVGRDGGYAIAGHKDMGTTYYDSYLVKTDEKGNQLWQQTYGGSDTDLTYAIDTTADGGYILAGETRSFGAGRYDMYLIKTDKNGNMLWQKTYGGTESDAAKAIRLTPDGGYILAGVSYGFDDIKGNCYVVKTDAEGNLQWQKTYGGVGQENAATIELLPDGGYLVAGTQFKESGESSMYAIRLDINGNEIWQKTFGPGNYNQAYAARITPDGNYLFAGPTASKQYGVNDGQMYLVKTDPSGNILWQKAYGGEDYDIAYSLAVNKDNTYVLIGASSISGNRDVYVVKVDSQGTQLWAQTYGGTGTEIPFGVNITEDWGIVIGGLSDSFSENLFDMYILKLKGDKPNCFKAYCPDGTPNCEICETAPPASSEEECSKKPSFTVN